MTKSALPFSLAGLLGGLGVCLVALATGGRAQQPTSTPAANVEASTPDETKRDDATPATDTEIFAMDGAMFTAKTRIAVFTGKVRVNDPRFTLVCDKLTVFLAKGAVPGVAPSPTPAPTATPPPLAADAKSEDAERPSGIDHALAEGHVIIIQKRAPTKPGEEEKTSIGRADTVEYDNVTGNMTLRGMPKVEQNGNSTEALSRTTYMIIHRDNSMEVHGPNRTHLVQRSKTADAPGSRPAGSPAANKRSPAPATQS